MLSDERNAKISSHYGTVGLLDRIIDAAKRSGLILDAVNSKEFSPVAEFHIGGRAATVELGEMARLRSGQRVLDVGSGLGGPARTLAEEFDVLVDGVDLTPEFCDVATELTRLSGLDTKAKFFNGDALNLPVDVGDYDFVWTQQACMNIEDKIRLVNEIQRVLKPGGSYIFQEIFLGHEGGEVTFPVPWAPSCEMSFLWPYEKFNKLAIDAGMINVSMVDVTSQLIGEYRKVAASTSNLSLPHMLGVHLILGEQAGLMRTNVVKNLESGTIGVVRGIYQKDSN